METLKFEPHGQAPPVWHERPQRSSVWSPQATWKCCLNASFLEAACEVEIATPLTGYGETWKAVVAEFVERSSPGGLRISINDGGARPDTVFLRLMQGSALMETE